MYPAFALNRDRRVSLQVPTTPGTGLSRLVSIQDTVGMSSMNVQSHLSARSKVSEDSGAPSEFANNQGSEKRNSNSHRDSSPNKDNDGVPLWRRGKTRTNIVDLASKRLSRKQTMMDHRLNALAKKNPNLKRA